MKKLHIFIIRSFIQPFISTLFIVLFILLMLFLFKYIDELIGKSFPWYTIMQLIFYANLTNVTLALPLAILLSSIMTFGDMGEKYELVAIKSAGISLQRAMYPLIGVVMVLTVAAFYFSNNIGPYAWLKQISILYDVRQLKPNFLIKPGVFNNDLGGFTIRAEEKEKNNILHHIMIYDHTENSGNTNVILAGTGKMVKSDDDKFLLFTLRDGVRYEESSSGNNYNPRQRFVRFNFRESEQRFPLDGFKLTRTDESLFRNSFMMMNIPQLKKTEDSLGKQIGNSMTQLERSIKVNFAYFNQRARLDALKAHLISYKRTDVLDNLGNTNSKLAAVNNALGSMRNVRAYIPGVQETTKQIDSELRKYLVEHDRKFTMSVACLVLFFIGAPMGAIIRKGGLGMPMVISIFFFLVFQILMNTGEKYSKEGVLPVYQGVWMATVVLVPIGLFLTYKASTDSEIFDIENYLNFFKRFAFWRRAK